MEANPETRPKACSQDGYQDWNTTLSTGCFASLNATNPIYTDLSVSNKNRAWNWLLCNEP